MISDFLHMTEDGDLAELKTFLHDNKIDINATNFLKQTALMLAVKQDHPKCVKELIKAGADLNKQDKFGWTALMIGTLNNNAECVQILVNASAKIDIVNDSLETAWHIAELYKIPESKAILDDAWDKYEQQKREEHRNTRPYYELHPSPTLK